MKKQQQIPLTPVLAIALVIVLAVAYFLLIRPKSAEVTSLDDEIASLQTQAAVASHDPGKPAPKVEIDVADLFRLGKALPDKSDMAGIMLELNAIASSSGVGFNSIAPGEPVTFGDYSAVPINLTFDGNYYDLTDFLYRLRNLVTVKDGVLGAEGRLYTLDSLDMHEAPEHFPQIEAVLTLSAYSYGAPAVPADGTAPPAPSTTTTTPATGGTTTGETTTGETATTSTTETPTTPVTTDEAPAAAPAN